MRSTVMVVGLAVASCAPPHVALRLPPNPTPEQRVAAYHALAAESEKTTWTECGVGCASGIEKTLRLTNGTSVHYAEDLLPVLPVNSVAAREVDQALTAKLHARYASMFMLASLVGFGLAGAHWMNASDERIEPDPTASEAILIGTSLVGMIAGGLFVWHYDGQYAKHFGAANRAYNDGLAEQLNVCVSGYALVACETLPPAAR